MVNICHIHLSKPIGCTRVNPNVTYSLGVIMKCQCRFPQCNTCTPQCGILTVEKLCTWEAWDRLKPSVPAALLCSEPKTTLENKVYLKGKEKRHREGYGEKKRLHKQVSQNTKHLVVGITDDFYFPHTNLNVSNLL